MLITNNEAMLKEHFNSIWIRKSIRLFYFSNVLLMVKENLFNNQNMFRLQWLFWESTFTFLSDGKENFAKIGFAVNNTCGGLNMRAF